MATQDLNREGVKPALKIRNVTCGLLHTVPPSPLTLLRESKPTKQATVLAPYPVGAVTQGQGKESVPGNRECSGRDCSVSRVAKSFDLLTHFVGIRKTT